MVGHELSDWTVHEIPSATVFHMVFYSGKDEMSSSNAGQPSLPRNKANGSAVMRCWRGCAIVGMNMTWMVKRGFRARTGAWSYAVGLQPQDANRRLDYMSSDRRKISNLVLSALCV
jgi:hypothetical protein